jgi:DNA-binding FrmR family transcriptional regulator
MTETPNATLVAWQSGTGADSGTPATGPDGALAAEPEVREKASARLRRIEGQVRGIQKMVEEGRYCPDILVQVASVRAALKGVSKVLMRQHLQHCVTDALRSGNPVAAERTYDEVMELMYRHAGD